jgi:hypothetical protein
MDCVKNRKNSNDIWKKANDWIIYIPKNSSVRSRSPMENEIVWKKTRKLSQHMVEMVSSKSIYCLMSLRRRFMASKRNTADKMESSMTKK